MAINFPSTAGQATDGSYTYTVAGIVYAWDGSSWEAAGAGASATDRTLFSVTTNSAGSAALSYNNNSGVFTYTPPDLSSYLTAEADTLSSVTLRGNSTSQGLVLTGGNLNSNAGHIYFNDSSNEQHIGWVQREGVIRQYNNRLRIMGGNPYEEMAVFNVDGSVELYHNASKKIETTSTGATITGALTAGGLTYPTTNGNSGDVLTSNGSGSVTWTAPTGLQTRGTALVTQSIANGAIANLNITTPKTYALMKIETSHAAWVTLYTSTNARTADASRSETTDPTPGSGVLAEVITTGNTTQLITPATVCFNDSGVGTTYAKIVNKSGSTANVSVTLTYLQLEA